ncbi:transcriptional regulator [Pseudolabrys taiwanensis]|uniref:Transcriptional regulator n=1 Tax=Pseudolabrys taiwanensis TaxID=331696 RepID=A0A346A0G2_9HYPH|nr:cyclic nucleotide-binding domain-containing protein [Pseudolabrys taiwanensis]AXK82659.1 transcriptional regulator [Pseudolabrys taiwanensis]
MRPSDGSIIRALPLFSDIGESNFAALMNAAFLQRFPAHVSLIAEGDPADFLHIVVEGTVELYARHADRETTLDVIGPVTTFILAAVIRDDVYLKSARTLSPAQILMVPAQTVRDVFDRDAAFARAIVTELADRYRDFVRALKNEKLRTSTERLAAWILKADGKHNGEYVIEMHCDKRTLASQLGMTPENLSRSFSSLKKYGVRTLGRGIVVEDPSALRRIAQLNPLIDGPDSCL